MSRFRVQTNIDNASGYYSVELYYPHDSTEPALTTPPIYPSHEIAEQETLRIIKEVFKSD